jgi:hypothetical protein
MSDPVTLGTLGGWAASEGIKFLYGQAAELLKAWRERRARAAAGEEPPARLTVPIVASDVLDGTPAEPVVDVAVLDQENAALIRLLGGLAPYAQGLADLDPDDTELAEQAGQLRALLEAAYGQRFTFRGEQRDPTGTRVSVTQVLGHVGGDVLGIEADVAPGADADIRQQATTVEPGGSITGFKGNIGR